MDTKKAEVKKAEVKKPEPKKEHVIIEQAQGRKVWATQEGLVSIACIANEKAAERVKALIKENGITSDVIAPRGKSFILGRKPEQYGNKDSLKESRLFRKALREQGLLASSK